MGYVRFEFHSSIFRVLMNKSYESCDYDDSVVGCEFIFCLLGEVAEGVLSYFNC